jgi:hypothetical protein
MKLIASLICLAIILAAASGCGPPAGKDNKGFNSNMIIGNATTVVAGPVDNDNKDRKPMFTISKETTYVTGPIDKDGYIDYAAALNERQSKGVTAENNANVLIWKALGPRPNGDKRMPAEFFKLMGMDEPPDKGEYFVDLRRFLREQLTIQDPAVIAEIERQQSLANRYPWTAKDHPQIAGWLQANDKPLSVVIEAMKRPHYFSPIVRSSDAGEFAQLLPLQATLETARKLATALAVRAMYRAGEGKPDAAWQDLLACQRFARYFARGGTMIAGLVGFACDQIGQRGTIVLLERPDVNAQLLADVSRDLRALPPMPSLADHLDGGERFFCLDCYFSAARRGAAGLAELTRGAGVDVAEIGEIDWDPVLRQANKHFDRMAAGVRKVERNEREKEFDRIEMELKLLKIEREGSKDGFAEMTPQARSKSIGDVLITLVTPAIRKIQEAFDRTEQGNRNLHVAVALAAYHRDQGSYPKTLDALAPKYLAKIPDDLFTGKPLVYRPSENGYLLYSFGPNGKDDGGSGVFDDPKGDDVNVRMPVTKPFKK